MKCDIPCDDDCDAVCHAGHYVFWKKDHPDFDCQRPCYGKNSNVCVGEGCYGDACIRGYKR